MGCHVEELCKLFALQEKRLETSFTFAWATGANVKTKGQVSVEFLRRFGVGKEEYPTANKEYPIPKGPGLILQFSTANRANFANGRLGMFIRILDFVILWVFRSLGISSFYGAWVAGSFCNLTGGCWSPRRRAL